MALELELPTRFAESELSTEDAVAAGSLSSHDISSTSTYKRNTFYGHVGCGAILGVASRYYLTTTHYKLFNVDGDDNALVHSNLANIVACLVLGFLKGAKAPPHVSALIGTGFCGAMSTFSTFMKELAIIVLLRGGWGVATALLAVCISTSSCYSFYQLGISIGSPRYAAELLQKLPSNINVAAWLLLAATLITLIAAGASIDASTFDVSMLVAACVAPLGAWIRYALAARNGKYEIPWMTMLGNVMASAIGVAGYLGTLRGQCSASSAAWSAALSGFVIGFCGALSTMSTFISELYKLDLHRAFKYASASMFLSQLFAWAMLVPYGVQYNCWW